MTDVAFCNLLPGKRINDGHSSELIKLSESWFDIPERDSNVDLDESHPGTGDEQTVAKRPNNQVGIL